MVDQPVAGRVHKKAVMAQKIYTDDGKLHSCQKKRPAECFAVKQQLKLSLPPARYSLTRAGPHEGVEEEYGYTEKAAPVSTRKRL
jgi:hypothetical protein